MVEPAGGVKLTFWGGTASTTCVTMSRSAAAAAGTASLRRARRGRWERSAPRGLVGLVRARFIQRKNSRLRVMDTLSPFPSCEVLDHPRPVWVGGQRDSGHRYRFGTNGLEL